MLLVTVSLVLLYSATNSICFADENDEQAFAYSTHIDISKNLKAFDKRNLHKFARIITDLLSVTRNIVAKNQELINRDPTTGNYYFKGFVPAVVGSDIANDFSLLTGWKLKQTSLKVRNPSNAPDGWEEKVLKSFETMEGTKAVSFGEIVEINGQTTYRYMKPIYVNKPCLECHGDKRKLKPAIKKFMTKRYPHDQAYGYKEGDIRGGISIIIPIDQNNY
ncbi:MAG: DUF3365 domain-containing protein [Candidatus Scalindua sp. AMX11]|nr:MAG: DUF3365 domain-containing protein [Candidatus Scalindua sp.]TDE65839.1 MAG: DUF3365 domain-containing protein [Candidatus Scalindua sp. AMX11]